MKVGAGLGRGKRLGSKKEKKKKQKKKKKKKEEKKKKKKKKTKDKNHLIPCCSRSPASGGFYW